MSLIFGFILGSGVTLFLFYRKKKKDEAERKNKVNNPEGSNKKFNEGEDEL